MTIGMRDHEFALILSGIALADGDEVDPIEAGANALFEAGCDDATLSLHRGVYVLNFSRQAPSRKAALVTAIQDVRRNSVGIEVVRVDGCHLVTQAEMAKRTGLSRQMVSLLISG